MFLTSYDLLRYLLKPCNAARLRLETAAASRPLAPRKVRHEPRFSSCFRHLLAAAACETTDF